jgi:ATP-dependent Clp protease protease subunit
MARASDGNEQLLCSFCGKSQRQVKKLIAEHTGQALDKVEKDTDRDFILTAQEAVDYGVVDEVISTRKLRPELAAAASGAS